MLLVRRLDASGARSVPIQRPASCKRWPDARRTERNVDEQVRARMPLPCKRNRTTTEPIHLVISFSLIVAVCPPEVHKQRLSKGRPGFLAPFSLHASHPTINPSRFGLLESKRCCPISLHVTPPHTVVPLDCSTTDLLARSRTCSFAWLLDYFVYVHVPSTLITACNRSGPAPFGSFQGFVRPGGQAHQSRLAGESG